jgi:tetratricopeptide (TPR) repeat protein
MRFSKLTDNVINALPVGVKSEDIFKTLFKPLHQTSFIKLTKWGEFSSHKYLELNITARILQKELNIAEPWYNKGNELNGLKKYNEAINCYDKAIEIIQNYGGAWYHRGKALNSLGMNKEAKASFDRAKELGYNE